MGGPSAKADRVIAAIASRQHGVVTRLQLLAAGVSPRQIERRLAKGTLIALHPGVYRVGHAAPCIEADYAAAVLACGDGAVLCCRAAAHLLGVIRGVPAPEPTVAARKKRVVAGVEVVRAALDARDVARCKGIPVTSVARTIVDLAGELSEDELARAVHEVQIRHGCTPDEIDAALKRKPNGRGTARLRAVLHGDARQTASKLERLFIRLLRRNKLPLPLTNQRAGGRLVDSRWPDRRLTVELDSYRYHNSRHAFEQDRMREREAYARGDHFRRYTWGDVVERPQVVLTELRPILSQALVD